MNLANFITENMESILIEWQEYATSLEVCKRLSKDELRDHAKVMLTTIAQDLMSPQSSEQQQNKSEGKTDNPGKFSTKMKEKATSHGEARFVSGFSIQEVVSEFRALRASVLRLWDKTPQLAKLSDLTEINRFNESIDQVLADSVDVFAIHKDKDIRILKASMSASPDHNFILNTDGEFLYVNKSMAEQMAINVEDILGKKIFEFQVMKENEWVLTLKKAIQNKTPSLGETRYELDDGKNCFYEYTLTPILDASGEVEALTVSERDITERKSREETAWHQATFDHLTELPNRNLFLDRLNEEIKRTKRSESLAALFFIDVDHFKEINDNFGHGIGDTLLKQVATRISACVRKNDTVARIGGDEFTIILAEFKQISFVKKIADKVIADLAKPFHVFDHILKISGSIGISLIPKDGITAEVLITNADKAMYEAKRKGRNQYKFYSSQIK